MKRGLWAILHFLAALLATAVIALTVLPMIRSGNWVIQAAEFPRLQILGVAGVVAAALSVCLWGRGRKPHLVTLLVLTFAAMVWQTMHILPFTRLWPREIAQATRTDVRFLVSNLKVKNGQHATVREVLAAEEADVLLLIEIDETWAEALAPLRERFTHHSEELRGEGLGIALWSKVPVNAVEVRHLVSDKRASIHADMTIAGREVAFVGLHPAPPGLPSDNGERYDSRIRDAELMKVADEIELRPDHHWIIAGDFNDVAWSGTTKLFKEVSGLSDPRVGRELLNTYDAQRPLLRYPIDHVFLSDSFATRAMRRIRVHGSDHFAVVIDLEIAKSDAAPPEREPEKEQEAEEMEREGEQDAAKHGEGDGAERDTGPGNAPAPPDS